MYNKQVTVFSNRAFKLKRNGKPTIEFKAGRNVVDIDAANHPYVRAHVVDMPEGDSDAELIAAYDRIKELENQVSLLENSNASQVAYAADLDKSFTRERERANAAEAKVADLEKQVAENAATIQALIDAANAGGQGQPNVKKK